MKIIDENGRLWGKISVIDLLVIAVVLVMALALYVKNVRMNADQKPVSSEPAQTITIQVRAEAQKDYIFNSLHVGDEIWDADHFDGKNVLGVITAIEVENNPGTALTGLTDGTVERIPIEGTVDMLITIESSATLEGRTYTVNDEYRVGVNSKRNYSTLLTKFIGTVMDVY